MEYAERMLAYLREAPKAELHVHLEGTIQPSTLFTLARRNRVDLPAANEQELARWFVYRDFQHFVEIFGTVSRCLRTVEDYELLVYEFGREMHRQHIRYAEVTFSASTHYFVLHVPHDVYLSGLNRGRELARQDFGVEMRWVFDIVRDIADEADRVRRADFTTRAALESRDAGVIALGLGGYEQGYPPEQFARWFELALSEGLHSVPHAGEGDGPTSVWGALRTLGAERIGHGVRSIEDPDLVAHLASHRIPLEVCPGSNICLGIYPSYTAHPLLRLHTAGVPFSINSDDPPLLNTTLNQDVARLYDTFGLDLVAIDEILLNGVRHSFLPFEQKQAMEREFRQEMTRLHVLYNLAR